MALTSLTSGVPPISHNPLDLAFMDRGSIDLNKHAFDLNEVPLLDLNLDFYDASTSGPSTPWLSSPLPLPPSLSTTVPHFGTNNTLPPKKGGWLELFQNMFGHEQMVGCLPFTSEGATGLSSSSSSGGIGEHHRWPGGKRCKLDLENHRLGAPLKKRSRIDNDHVCYGVVDQQPNHNPARDADYHLISKCENRSRTAESTAFYMFGKDRFQEPWQTSQNLFKRSPDQTIGPLFRKEDSLLRSIPHIAAEQNKTDYLFDVGNIKLDQKEAVASPKLLSKSAGLPGTFVGLSEQGFSICNPLQITSGCALLSDDTFVQSERTCQRWRRESRINASQVPKRCSDILPQPGKEIQEPLIKVIPSPDWLPSTWITELKTRKSGTTAGTTDKYYKDPLTGRRFRSRNEVMNYLQTGCVNRCKPKVKYIQDVPSSSLSLLPMQDPLSDVQNISNDYLLNTNGSNLQSPPRTVRTGTPGFLPVYAKSTSPEASVQWDIQSPNLVVEKVAVKQEDLWSGGTDTWNNHFKAMDVCSVKNFCDVKKPLLGTEGKCKEDSGTPRRLTMRTSFETDMQQQCTIDIMSDMQIGLPSKYRCFDLNSWSPKDPQNTWTAYINTPLVLPEAGGRAHGGVCKSSVLNYRGDQSSADPVVPMQLSMPQVLPVRGEFYDQMTFVPYQTNIPRDTLQGMGQDPVDSRFGHVNSRKLQRGPSRKAVNLTIKQHRELLASLGRKLCQQYLQSASTILPSVCGNLDGGK